MHDTLSRRKMLAGLTAAGAVAIAGCGSPGGDGENDTSPDGGSPEESPAGDESPEESPMGSPEEGPMGSPEEGPIMPGNETEMGNETDNETTANETDGGGILG